jgi:hypothetical protein
MPESRIELQCVTCSLKTSHVRENKARRRRRIRTDITPERDGIQSIVRPNNDIHAGDNVDEEEPAHNGKRRDIARTPVPRYGDGNEHGSEESKKGKVNVRHGLTAQVAGVAKRGERWCMAHCCILSEGQSMSVFGEQWILWQWSADV